MATIVARPFCGSGIFQKDGSLKRNGIHIRRVGISEKRVIKIMFEKDLRTF